MCKDSFLLPFTMQTVHCHTKLRVCYLASTTFQRSLDRLGSWTIQGLSARRLPVVGPRVCCAKRKGYPFFVLVVSLSRVSRRSQQCLGCRIAHPRKANEEVLRQEVVHVCPQKPRRPKGTGRIRISVLTASCMTILCRQRMCCGASGASATRCWGMML